LITGDLQRAPILFESEPVKFLMVAVGTLLASTLDPFTDSVHNPAVAFAIISAAVKLPYGVMIFLATLFLI
jgi:hypothetical protein